MGKPRISGPFDYRMLYKSQPGNRVVERQCSMQRGFSLIEVLVALVLLSVGLLGLAGLQLASLNSNVDALARSQATLGAESILERIRANAQDAARYATRFEDGADAYQGDDNDGSLAMADLTAWKSQLADTLPGGAGQITLAGESCNGRIANCRVTVTVQWFDKGNDTALDQKAAIDEQTQTRRQQFAVQTQL